MKNFEIDLQFIFITIFSFSVKVWFSYDGEKAYKLEAPIDTFDEACSLIIGPKGQVLK